MNTLFLSHIGLAYISLGLLLLRGVLSARRVEWRQYKTLRIAPHLIDTILLITGISLFIFWGFSLQDTWVWSKLLFLVLYIVFATKAFKKGQPFSLKHFLLAVVSFMLMMLIATTH